MKKAIGLICLIIGFLISCSDDTLNTSDFVAGEVFTSSNSRVINIDTMTIEMATIKFDSIITSTADRMLIGKYNDDVFGKTQSASYMGLLPSEYTIDTEAKYDSIAFYIKYDGYYYNDTLNTNTIHIKQLNDNFDVGRGDNYYNTSNVTYNENDLGFISYIPRPFSSDSLEIKIDDDFGNTLFDDLQKKLITNNEEFLNKYKGVAFVPGEDDNGSVIGFGKSSETCYLRLYHSTSEADDIVQSYIDFTLNTTETPNPFFNQIKATEPIDYLQTLTNSEIDLNSIDSDNKTFIQSGIGIATKISFPYLKSIQNIQGKGTLLNAVLKIKPVTGSYNDNLMLRDNFSVYTVDKNNDLIQQLYQNSGSEVDGILNYESEEFNELYYEIPLTSYIESILTADTNTTESLLLIPSTYSTTIDRFILNGSNTTTNNKTTLEITYAIYDENN